MSVSTPALTTRALWPALVTALLWCAAAASGVFWMLQLPQAKSVLNAPTMQAGASQAAGPEVAAQALRALGGQSRAPEVSVAQASRYQLWGVVAGASGQGSALIGIDGQPPKAYRVGQAVSEGLYLQSLGSRQARIGATAEGSSLTTLTLPAPDKSP